MFPYADNAGSYWTGYFTSRSTDKEYIRRASHNFHAANKLYALEMIKQSATPARQSDVADQKNQMFDVMGINQHHDAVTGTGKQAVANNYAKKVYAGMQTNNKLFAQILNETITFLAS